MPRFVVRMVGFKLPMAENAAELVDNFGSEVDDRDWNLSTCDGQRTADMQRNRF